MPSMTATEPPRVWWRLRTLESVEPRQHHASSRLPGARGPDGPVAPARDRAAPGRRDPCRAAALGVNPDTLRNWVNEADVDGGKRPGVPAGERAADLLRRLLAAVEEGRLDADGPVAAGLVRQMQGAAEALDLADVLMVLNRSRGRHIPHAGRTSGTGASARRGCSRAARAPGSPPPPRRSGCARPRRTRSRL